MPKIIDDARKEIEKFGAECQTGKDTASDESLGVNYLLINQRSLIY